MEIRQALTFDDVMLVPAASVIMPGETDTRTRLTREIELGIAVSVTVSIAAETSGMPSSISRGEAESGYLRLPGHDHGRRRDHSITSLEGQSLPNFLSAPPFRWRRTIHHHAAARRNWRRPIWPAPIINMVIPAPFEARRKRAD